MERLKSCMEEIVKFTLESHINHTLEIDLGLSTGFCSNLLADDPNGSVSGVASDLFKGVPEHPLYKRLTLSLCESIISGAICVAHKQFAYIQEDNNLKLYKQEWNKLFQEKGSELLNILNCINFELNIQEPFFSYLKDGLKTIEGRCAVGKFNRIRPGAWILFNKYYVVEVQDVRQYSSMSEMLDTEGIAKVLPGVETVEAGLQIYRKFYDEEMERSNGVLAISVSKVASQPHISVGSILSELTYRGVKSLLGIAHTTGTVSDGLPPPKSTLLSSFVLPYNSNAKGSTLTCGGRALAKHVNRSSDKYWGDVDGSDSNKNRLALDMITCLITSSCWMNIHIVPPHGDVFEIRVAEGYGARWSNNGTKFIGFLEPYMDDGHSKGWKH